MQWNNLTSTHFSRTNIFPSWDTRRNILERAKLCTCWEFPRSWYWKRDYGTSLNARRCNERKLQYIDNNRASSHFSRKYIFHTLNTREDILKRAKLCTYWEFPRFQDWKRDYGTSLNARRCNERKLHDIDNNLTSTHFLCRFVFHAWDTRGYIWVRVKPCTFWGPPSSRDWTHDCDTSLNARLWNERKLHDIDNNLTSTHFLRRHIFHAWDTHEDILVRAKSLHLLRTSKISRLNTRLWHIAKRETMQCNTTTWYRQQFHTHALFT